jgi:NADH dehydrogenase [ubiquinone] 1 alpha subcomplex assembly factor 1
MAPPSLSLDTMLLLCSLSLSATAKSLPESPMDPLINFDNSPQEPRWVAVNDGVMGGLSSGGAVVADGQLQFSGALSLENKGGFASVRSVGRDFDLSGAAAVVLRVRGDGRRYQLRLATDARYRGVAVSFGAEFGTRAGEWTEVRVPLKSLKATVRGSALQGPQMDPAQVREIGLLIADKREGAFALAVDWIAVEQAFF